MDAGLTRRQSLFGQVRSLATGSYWELDLNSRWHTPGFDCRNRQFSSDQGTRFNLFFATLMMLSGCDRGDPSRLAVPTFVARP
jgi:hypothetical protein